VLSLCLAQDATKHEIKDHFSGLFSLVQSEVQASRRNLSPAAVAPQLDRYTPTSDSSRYMQGRPKKTKKKKPVFLKDTRRAKCAFLSRPGCGVVMWPMSCLVHPDRRVHVPLVRSDSHPL